MSKRAFIIAIERYAQMQEGLISTLPGTHQHAREFRDWLITAHGLVPGDILFCTEDATVPGRTSDATCAAIKQELKRFKAAGKDATEDVFFYFSGHGFCYVDIDDLPTADVLLAADYVTREDSGGACLKLGEIQRWLKNCLGSVTAAGSSGCGHYYFIDACRNKVTEREIKVPSLDLTYDISVRKKAPVYTMYSASTGAVAAAAAGFPEALIDGLNGKGRAKRWYQGTFAVLFDSLRGYVSTRLAQDLDTTAESGDGVICTLAPTLEATCVLTVKNAAPQDQFEAEVKNDRQVAVSTFEFSGPTSTFTVSPDAYFVRVRLKPPAGGDVAPLSPMPADLYDDCALEYEKRPATRGAGPLSTATAPATASLSVLAPAYGLVTVRGAGANVLEGTGALHAEVKPGHYTVETADARGVAVNRRDITVGPGGHHLDLTELRQSPLRQSLLDAIHGQHGGGAVDFSESLGPTPDQELDLWLALIGAARIVGGQDDFSKLSPLPLATFDDVKAGGSAVYVLAGFERPGTVLRAILSDDWRARPAVVNPHPQFPGLFEIAVRSTASGSRYLSVQIDENAPVTVGVSSLPARGTLVTISRDAGGSLRVQQFILPLRQFQTHLPGGAGLWLDTTSPALDQELHNVSAPLRLVQRCVDVQRAFARAQDLSQLMGTRELEFLLYFKWFEPIVALLAAYELVRRGELVSLTTVVSNLRLHFPDLPDTEALAKLAGIAWRMPASPPLVLDGLQALDLMRVSANVPPGDALVFRGPWTMWRGLSDR